jgi:hypothetical protein
MKPISKAALALLFTLTTAVAFAQNSSSKSKIFQAFPEQLTCSESLFANAFNYKEGDNISFAFPGNFTFSGKVVRNIVKYNNLQSMVIVSEKFSNSIFHLSKQINEDKSITFVGRILNSETSDGYQLKRDEKGNYILAKIETGNILQDCSYIK